MSASRSNLDKCEEREVSGIMQMSQEEIIQNIGQINDPELDRLFLLIHDNMEIIKNNPQLVDLVVCAIKNVCEK
jgi:hypothetical protein